MAISTLSSAPSCSRGAPAQCLRVQSDRVHSANPRSSVLDLKNRNSSDPAGECSALSSVLRRSQGRLDEGKSWGLDAKRFYPDGAEWREAGCVSKLQIPVQPSSNAFQFNALTEERAYVSVTVLHFGQALKVGLMNCFPLLRRGLS